MSDPINIGILFRNGDVEIAFQDMQYDLNYLESETQADISVDDVDPINGKLTVTLDYIWDMNDFVTIQGVDDE